MIHLLAVDYLIADFSSLLLRRRWALELVSRYHGQASAWCAASNIHRGEQDTLDMIKHKETGDERAPRAHTRTRTESFFRAMVELAPDATVVMDRDGRITLVNRQTELLFGYARAELLGQSVEVLIPE